MTQSQLFIVKINVWGKTMPLNELLNQFPIIKAIKDWQRERKRELEVAHELFYRCDTTGEIGIEEMWSQADQYAKNEGLDSGKIRTELNRLLNPSDKKTISYYRTH